MFWIPPLRDFLSVRAIDSDSRDAKLPNHLNGRQSLPDPCHGAEVGQPTGTAVWEMYSGQERVVARSRRALAITDTLLKLIAAAANIGLSRVPKTGYSKPAAIGMPKAL